MSIKFYSFTIYYYIHSTEWVFVFTHKDIKSLSFGNWEKSIIPILFKTALEGETGEMVEEDPTSVFSTYSVTQPATCNSPPRAQRVYIISSV